MSSSIYLHTGSDEEYRNAKFSARVNASSLDGNPNLSIYSGDAEVCFFMSRAQLEQVFGAINNWLEANTPQKTPVEVECRKCDARVILLSDYDPEYALCNSCAMSKAGI